MLLVTITLDTSSAGKEEVEDITLGGKVICAAGLINLKWEDFSAIDVARSIGLQETLWQSSYDDTPGFLTLTIHYFCLTPDEIHAKLENRPEIEDYEIQQPVSLKALRLNGNFGSPNSRN